MTASVNKDQDPGFSPEAVKYLRPPPGASEPKKDTSGADIQAVIAKVMSGEANVEEVLSLYPNIVAELQKTFGNDAIAILMGGAGKKEGSDSKGGGGGKDAGGGKGASPKEPGPGEKAGGAIGGAIGGVIGGMIGHNTGAHGGGTIGHKGGMVIGGLIGSKAGSMLDAIKGKAADEADKTKKGEDPTQSKKGADGKDGKDEGHHKGGKHLGHIKGLDPVGGIRDAIKNLGHKHGTDGKDGKDGKAGHQADIKKGDDSLIKLTDKKGAQNGGGMASNSANAVQDAAKAVASKKGLGDEVKGKYDTKGDGKDAKGSKGDGKDAKGSKGDGKDAKGSKGDGKDAKGDGKDAKGSKGDGKNDGKGGAWEDPTKVSAKDQADAKKDPAAQEAQKAKDQAGKDGGGGGGPGGEGKDGPAPDGKEGGGGPGAEGKEGAAPEAGGGGPAPEAGGGGGGAAPAPAAPTVKGTLDQYIKSHPDLDAQKRVEDKGFANDKLARDANVLKSNVTPPPDKSWMDAVTPRQEWFAFKKGVMGPNKWTGQDAGLDFMTRLNAALDSIGGAASKIGLAATIGGAILTLLVPPVGAFLLSVGRVCNAISLVCSAFRIVSSIVQTVMLAVKAAREKDPIKRLEMMQEMKQSVQAGVMAGLDVVMSKLGGKGGGGAAAGVGGKSLEAAKAAFKEGFKSGGKGAMGVVKGVIKGSIGFVKVGAQTAFQGVKQMGKDAIAGIKGQISAMKQLGLKGTLKVAGQGIVNFAKDVGAGFKKLGQDKFIKPFTDLKSAWKSCGQFRQNWADFRSMIAANGGGRGGYLKTIQQLNFPSLAAGGNWKQKVGAVFQDMTNTSKGGYAAQVVAGMEGKHSSAHKYEKHADGTDLLDHNGNKILDTSKYKDAAGNFTGAGATSAGGMLANEQLTKLNALKKIQQNGSEMEKRKALNDGKLTSSDLEEAANAKTQNTGASGLKQRHQNYKDNLGAQYQGMAYVVPGHMPQSYLVKTNLDWQLEQKVKAMEDGFKMVNPAWGKMAWDAGKGAYAVSQGKAEWSDVGQGMLTNTGKTGAWATKTFGGSSDKKSAADKASAKESSEKWGDWDQLKFGGGYNGGPSSIPGTVMNTVSEAGKKGLADAGKKADANRAAAVKAYGQSYQAKVGAGVTAGKVTAATAGAMATIKQRESDIQSAMVNSGPKTAAIPSPGGATGGMSMPTPAPAIAATETKQPPPPPPPAPPEGTTIPSMDLLPQIDAQRAKIAKIKADVTADIKASEEIKAQAIGADAKLAEYATGLTQQATEIGVQKTEATKDVADVQKSKQDIAAGGKQVGEKKGAAEGEKSKTEAKASEGKAVQNPQVDNSAKKAKEDEKAAQEKAAWDREYSSANAAKKLWMQGKKLVGGVFAWVAKAAKLVWDTLLKPAIEAVKSAVAKVLGMITDLMMKGILAIVKLFLSKEEGARLDETMADMKKVEAEQAKKSTEEVGAKNEEAKVKLGSAQQSAKAKIDHAQGNIQTGQQLLTQADANKAALDQEEADIKAKNDAFKAQYGPYFDWVAQQEAEQASGKGAGDGKDAGGGKAPAPDPVKQNPGTDGMGGGGQVKDPGVKTPPVNDGKKDDGKTEHPADKKLDVTIAISIQLAITVVIADSQGAQSEIGRAASGKSSKVISIATQIGRQNEDMLKAAGQKGDPSKLGSILADEGQKTSAVKASAGNVTGAVVGGHTKAEQERQARLNVLSSKAGSLNGMSIGEGAALAQNIAKELAREAKGVDDARNEAMMELDKGFSRSLGAN